MKKLTIKKQWENLSANKTDGFYADRKGLQHTVVYKERLQFVEDKVMEREEEIIKIIRNFKIPDNAKIIPDGVDVRDEYKENFYNLMIELIIKQIKK